MRNAVARRANATTAIAVLALVFSLSGGAWAASRYLITSTKQIKPSVLAQLKARGRAGASGPAGPAGPAGAAGPRGPQGPPGAGTPGTEGKEGKEGREGKEGKEGREGEAGQTGFTETLPAGKTETGTWSVNLFQPGFEEVFFIPITFAIPPAAGGEAFYLSGSETAGKAGTGGCTGTAALPTAPSGKLCIYTEEEENEKLPIAPKTIFGEKFGRYGKPGSFLEFEVETGGQASARGSWAVTG